MKLKDTEKAVILVLVGIAVCVLSILYIAKPNFEKRGQLENESAQLQIRLNDLRAKEADREMYEEGIREYTQKFETILDAFPADLNQEITIMFLQGIKDSNEFTIDSLGLGEKTLFYTLGGSNASDAVLDENAQSTETTAADSTEAAVPSDVPEEPSENALTCYTAAFPISYTGSYESLKDVVAYIDHYSDRMTVNTLNITYTADVGYSGNLELACYSVEGPDRPERSLELNQVEIGVDNIFEGGNSGGSKSSSLNKYDDTEGAAIETAYDFYAMLNPATSDVSAKVIGQNGTGKEDTVLSDSDDTVSIISYDFYELDGKNYCKYTLDNDQSYEAEVTSAEDVKLLIQSSERKNDEDKVGAKVIVSNSTSLPVYVKVSGDDAVSPRVTISKTGLVKVYQ